MDNLKKYYECLDEISEDELYEGLLGYGLFADKLPPIFTSVNFYNYITSNSISYKNIPREYIRYSSMRNTNVPRALGIPEPFAYNSHIIEIKSNWENIKEYFKIKTEHNSHKISRIHIRKIYNENGEAKHTLFEMNYDNYRKDGDPDIDLLIGKRILVKTDISNFFPSIYTHSICWALAGKDTAKQNRNDKKQWYNKIDSTTQKLTNGETHGLIIGPHSSNLISEIVLVFIDKILSKKYMYTRHIDDIRCYVDSIDEANHFILDLNVELQKFGLNINNKKTEIIQLPVSNNESWIEEICNLLKILGTKNENKNEPNGVDSTILKGSKEEKIFTYNDILSYFDKVTDVMKKNGNDSSIINYAVKALLGNIENNIISLSKNAKQVCSKLLIHYTLLYPYLVRIIDDCVFEKFNTEKNLIRLFINKAFDNGVADNNYEEICYSLLFAIKYGSKISNIDKSNLIIIDNSDCISKLFLWLYCKKFNEIEISDNIHNKALQLAEYSFDENWLLCYEILSFDEIKLVNNINDYWKKIKEKNISFLNNEIRKVCGL